MQAATGEEEDVLCFFARSADAAPGKGAGEKVVDASRYAELATIPHWRRRFSSHWCESFGWRDRTYRTHSHALQAAKFMAADRSDVAEMFCVESGSRLGTTGTGLDADRSRKIALLTEEQMARWNDQRGAAKDEIYLAKFSALEECRRALLATAEARLWNRGPRIRALRNVRLENTRSLLRQTKTTHLQ